MKKSLLAALLSISLTAYAGDTLDQTMAELVAARDAITNAIVQKGGTVTSGALTNVPNEILSIPSGGGGGGPFLEVVTRQSSPTWTVSASDLAGVTIIGTYAFAFCSGLTSVAIPSTVTSIEDNAFQSCPSMTSITLSENINAIKTSTFAGCSALTSITIPDSVTSIAGKAFLSCSQLATIDFGTTRSTIPTLAAVNAFNGLPSNYQILVPSELLTTWKATSPWSDASVVDHIVAHP